jgi:hypothetical protein
MQVQSKDILVVKNLRKEVHCSMQIIVQTRWVIKEPEDARRVSGLVPVSAARKAIKLRNRFSGNADT